MRPRRLRCVLIGFACVLSSSSTAHRFSLSPWLCSVLRWGTQHSSSCFVRLFRHGFAAFERLRNVTAPRDVPQVTALLSAWLATACLPSGTPALWHPQVELMDVASLSSVKQFAERWDASKRPLHVLINNAGIMSFGCALVPLACDMPRTP